MNITEAQTLALNLMREHNLLELGWTFSFDSAKRRFGVCRHHLRSISISKALTEINSLEHVKDTILHEIAHALVGSGHGHDYVWKNKAFHIGADPTRCYDSSVVQPPRKWNGTCPNGHVTQRHRRMELACAKCCVKYNYGKYSDQFKFVWTEAEAPVATPAQ